MANKEKESTVIKFAMKEKSVIDAKKEKEIVEKQLADARKEIKNYTTKFQALNEEKSRVTYLMDEKVNKKNLNLNFISQIGTLLFLCNLQCLKT